MKFDVLTLFPDMFECLNQSIIGRAKEKELIDINLINIRDFSNNKHKKVDDTPYGGGSGMVMMPDVVYRAYESVKTKDARELEEGTYFIADILGSDVYTDTGDYLGKVDDIYNSGAQDIYVVKDELGKQILLPSIKEVILDIDIENQKVTVHLLKGLI